MTSLLKPLPKLIFLVAFALPILLLITGSLRTNAEMFQYAGQVSIHSFIPAEPTINAYQRVAQLPLFGWQLLNTVLLGLVLATGATATGILAAYALARFQFKGREGLFYLMLATMFIPIDVVLPPLFFVTRDLHILDTFWGLALPFIFSPMAIYLLRQAIQEVPIEIDQAAALDGAGPVEILRTAILPNIRGAILATWLMNFVFVWEWYLWPLIEMRRANGQLAQVAIAGLIDPMRSTDYALVFAAAILTIVPAFLVFALLQRFLVQSTATAGGK